MVIDINKIPQMQTAALPMGVDPSTYTVGQYNAPIFNQPPPTTGTPLGGNQGQGGFQFPWQWQQASDIYSNLGNIMGPMWQSMQQKAQTDITRGGREAVEQFGLGGLRQSTPLGQQLGQIGSEAMAGIMPQYWQLGLGAQQAAAGGLAGLGQQYANLPQQVAMNQMQMAQMQQNMQQQAFQPQLQQFQWGRPETYLPQAMQFAQGQYQQQPQMYQPSPFTNMLQGGLSGFGLANQLGWNPFSGGQQQDPWNKVPSMLG